MSDIIKAYQILNEARVAFRESGAKMSGKNDYAGYSYYELSDILPVVNRFAVDLKFTCIVKFTPELATLTFCTEFGNIEFTSPMSTASLKGCHEVQNLGAVETYIKRYLYQNCFEISEPDGLNATHNKPDTKQKQQQQQPQKQVQVSGETKLINQNQVKLLYTEISKRVIDQSKLKEYLNVNSMTEIGATKMDEVLKIIQKHPLKTKEQDMEQ